MSENPIDFNKYITGEEALKSAGRSTRALGKAVSELAKSVDADGARIKASLGQITEAMKAGQEAVSFKTGTRSVQELRQELAQLVKSQALLKESEAAATAAVKVVTEARQKQVTALQQQKEALLAATKANDVEAQRKAAAAIRQTKLESDQLTRAVRGVNSEFTAAKGSYDALTLANGKLLAQLRGLEGGLDSTSKEAQGLRIQIAANTSTLTDFDRQLGQNFRNVGNYPKGLASVKEEALGLAQTLAGTYLSFQALSQSIGAVFSANADFSDQLADVRKTTGLTADEADRLADSLKRINTRTSLAGLLEIAKVGGQLGIAKDDILGFTTAVDIAVQALGDDFSGGAEQIATELGKIAGVFRKELGPDVSQNLLAIGSAVNELGAVGAATAPFLTDVALRVGAVSAQTGVGLKNVLAYAAVLQETGFTAETSGTALNRFFSVLSTRTEEAFKIAQKANPALTLKEFTRLVNTDFSQAIQVFLKGLNAGGKSTTELSGLLSTLKLQSGEAKNVIITLAQNTELLAQRQATANEQLSESTSLAAEAAIKNDTLAGSYEKLKNKIVSLVTEGKVAGFFKGLIDGANSLLSANIKLIDRTDLLRYGTAALAQQTSKSADEMLAAYQNLNREQSKTPEQLQEMRRLTAELRKELGSSVAPLNQLSQQYELNTAAVAANIAKKRQEVDTIALKIAADADALQKQADGQRATAAALREEARARGRIFELNTPALAATEKANVAEERRRRLLVDLAALGYNEARIAALRATASKKAADSIVDDEEAIAESLGRTEKSLALQEAARQQARLKANQKSIDEIKAYVAAQNKASDAGQITAEALRESVAGTQDAITQLERDGTAIRIKIIRAETDAKLAEIERERTQSLKRKNLSQRERTDINGSAAADKKTATDKRERDILEEQAALQKRIDEIPPIEFRIVARDARPVLSAYTAISNQIQKTEADAQAELNRLYAHGLLTREGYDRKALQTHLETLQKQLALEKQFGRDTTALQKEIEDTKNQQAQQAAADRRRITQEVAEGVNVIESTYFQYRSQRLEAEQQQLQASYDQSLKNAGENEELKAQLTQEFDKKSRAIKRKQAESDRSAALFQIAINTAVNASQYTPINPLFYLALLSGAAQAALVLSKPIPFFKGRRGGEPVPFATVSERGPEIIHRKQQNRLEYVEKPAYTSLGRGDSVFTASETAAIMQGAHADVQAMRQPLQLGATLATSTAAIQAGRTDAGHGSAAHLSAITSELKRAVTALQNQTHVRVNVTDEGIRKALVQGASLSETMNQRLDKLLPRR